MSITRGELSSKNLPILKKVSYGLICFSIILAGVFSFTPVLAVESSNNSNSSSQTSEQKKEEDKKETTSCAIGGGGGWAVCMVSNTLAGAMDGLYDIVKGFLTVQPLQTTAKSGIFQAWDYMRNIANVIFVIVFIIVIYSQVTNLGIGNYGVKKLLPKLIIAAVLINLSYYICAIGIDLSNILGNEVQNLMINIRKDIVAQGFEVNVNWAQLVSGILAGTGVASYAFVAGGGWVGLAFAILGLLVGAVYSVMVTLIILAARQAIITMAVFLAPLAFAANILPNTEKWFEKWKDLFVTMLVMFPIVSLLFGGAQLAGMVIISNANGNIITLVLGMAVQVIPLAVTPMITKLSGSLLGKFAGMVNNPNKGPFDTAKNWTRDMRQNHINKLNTEGNNLTAKLGDWQNRNRWRRDHNKSLAEKYQRKRFEEFELAEVEAAKTAEQRDKLAGSTLGNNLKTAIKNGEIPRWRSTGNTIMQDNLADIEMKNIADRKAAVTSGLNAAILSDIGKKIEVDKVTGEVKITNPQDFKNLGLTASRLYDAMTESNAHKLASQNNQKVISNAIAENLKADEDLQVKSAGVRGEAGKMASLAWAFSEAQKLEKDEVDAMSNLLKNSTFYKDEVTRVDERDKVFNQASGTIETLEGVKLQINDTLRKAMIEDYMGTRDGSESLDLLGKTGAGDILHGVRANVVDAWKKVKKDDAQTMPGSFLGDIVTRGASRAEIDDRYIGKFFSSMSDETVTKISDDFMQVVNSKLSSQSPENLNKFAKTIESINSNKDMYSKIGANRGDAIWSAIEEIQKINPGAFSAGATFDNIKRNKK